MTKEMVFGILRAVIPAVIAFMAGKGVLPAADYGEVIAAVIAAAAGLWSIVEKFKSILNTTAK